MRCSEADPRAASSALGTGRLWGSVCLALLLVCAPGAWPAGAQILTDEGERLEFELAVIRQNRESQAPSGVRLQRGGRLELLNATVLQLVRVAYGLDRVAPQYIVNAPGWIGNERYDIVARADEEFGPRPPEGGYPPDVRARLRTLLQDRFKLRARAERREMQVYTLVLARGDGQLGPNLRRSEGTCRGPYTPLDPANPVAACPLVGIAGRMELGASSMADLAQFLAFFPAIERVVLDRTGVDGIWDMEVTFVPAFIDDPNNPGGRPIANPAADSGATLFTALQEQLGVRLQGSREPVDVLVIESIDRPSEN